MNEHCCAFTGQSLGLPEVPESFVALRNALRTHLRQLIEAEHVTRFISGMEPGADMLAAETILSMKDDYPHITLECAIPYELQASQWAEPLRDRYFDIAAKCDKETMLQTAYTMDCRRKHNQYIVTQADYLLAVWDGSPNQTGDTVAYARRQGKSLVLIDPSTLSLPSLPPPTVLCGKPRR